MALGVSTHVRKFPHPLPIKPNSLEIKVASVELCFIYITIIYVYNIYICITDILTILNWLPSSSSLFRFSSDFHPPSPHPAFFLLNLPSFFLALYIFNDLAAVQDDNHTLVMPPTWGVGEWGPEGAAGDAHNGCLN